MKEAEDGTKCKMLQGCIYSFMYYFILFYFILFGPLEIIPMVFKKNHTIIYVNYSCAA